MIEVYVSGGGDSYDPLNMQLSFYLVERNEFSGERYILNFANGLTSLTRIIEGFPTPAPTFTLGSDKGHEFLKAIAEIAYKRGIKLKSDEQREGKLEATEKHLADMRRIVFEEPS